MKTGTIKPIKTAQTATGTARPIVEFKQTKYCYFSKDEHKHWHLGPFSLEINSGELFVILGPSGSGKTTFMRLLAGLESPRSGAISLDRETVFNVQINVPPEKRQVGMMFQDHVLFPHLTVRQNIVFGIEDWDKPAREKRLLELKDLLGIEDYLDRYPHELSGGQQQRVALARTLAPNPKVILLDEPLCNIDADLRASLAQELKDIIKATHTTAVWVTHDQTEAFDIADRIAVLNDGNIEQVDTPSEIYLNPKTKFAAKFIGQSVFIRGKVAGENIVTEVGTIPNAQGYRNGTEVEVMARPEDIAAVPHDSENGIVCKRQFRGARNLYTIRLNSGKEVCSYQPAIGVWPMETKVKVSLNPRHAVVFSVTPQ